MNVLPIDVRCQVLDMLCEGVSMSSISRLVDVAKNTVSKLLVDFGTECAIWHNKNVRNVSCRQIQVDEIWSFVYAKEKNRHAIKQPRELTGSIWTWVAEDADSRMVLSFLSGRRGAVPTEIFINDLSERVTGRPEIITDGFMPYADAIEGGFGGRADHVMLLKADNRNWDWEKIGTPLRTTDHSRAVLMSGRFPAGRPSTSYVERHNLTMRRSISRLARKTNAFSKKPENHAAALALYMFWYNFIRIHRTLKCPPGVRAGVVGNAWDWGSVAELVDRRRAPLPKISRSKKQVTQTVDVAAPSPVEAIQRCWWLRQREGSGGNAV